MAFQRRETHQHLEYFFLRKVGESLCRRSCPVGTLVGIYIYRALVIIPSRFKIEDFSNLSLSLLFIVGMERRKNYDYS